MSSSQQPEQRWADPGLLLALWLLAGVQGFETEAVGCPHPIPPPQPGSQQRRKPEPAADGIPSIASTADTEPLGPQGRAAGNATPLSPAKFGSSAAGNNPRQRGDAGGTAPRGFLPYKGLQRRGHIQRRTSACWDQSR